MLACLLIPQKYQAILHYPVTEIWPGENTSLKSGFMVKASKLFSKFEF